MEQASAAARVVRPIDAGLLAAAAQRAADEVETHEDLAKAIEAATNAFYEAVAGAMPSVFVLEHGRLWLIAQRGYAVVPDGITVESGIIGRAVRLSRAQLASDVHADPDYVQALPGVVSELAIPLRAGRVVVGVLNIESERALPDGAAEALRPLVRALGPLAGELRANRTLDLPGLARLFVHLGSLRAPGDIAALAAASLPRVLPLEATRILVWSDLGATTELASWTSESATRPPLSVDEIESARAQTDPSVVFQVLQLERGTRRVASAARERRRAGRDGGAEHAVCARRSKPARHGRRARGSRRRLARRRLCAAARATQRRHGPPDADPEPARPRGAARTRARRGAGPAHTAEPARHRLRRLQGDQRPRGPRVRRHLAARSGGRALAIDPGRRRGRTARRRRVRRHVPGRRVRLGRSAGGADPHTPRGGPDGRGLPASDLRGRLDVPVRRRNADCAPSGRRPGAVCGEGLGQGSSRVVSRAHVHGAGGRL